MKHLIGGLALIVALAACGSKTDKQPTSETAGGAAEGPGLWALAPADAAAGFVVTGGAIDQLYAVLAEVERVAKVQPASAKLFAQLRAGVPTSPVDVLDRASAEAWGLDPSKGFALFFDADMQVIAGALPVKSLEVIAKADDKQVRMVGERKVVDSSDGDVCTEAAGYVLCGRDLETIDAALSGGGSAPLAKRVLALPAHRRGHVELMIDTRQVRDLREGLAAAAMVFQEPGLLAMSARLDRGVLRVNAALQGKLSAVSLRSPHPVPKSMQKLDVGATGVVQWQLDLKSALAQLPMPASMPVAEGVDLRRDLIDQLSGHFAILTRGSDLGGGALALGVLDEAPVRKALPAFCDVVAQQLPQAKITKGHSGCTAIVALPPDVPKELGDSMIVGVEVRDGALWASIGDPKPIAGAPGASAHTASLFDGAQFVMWGRSFDPFVHEPTRQAFDALLGSTLTPEQRGYLDAARWAVAHVAELGMALREGDGWLEQSIVVATHAADPADVYRAYEAAVAKDLQGDRAGYRAAMKELAGKSDTLAGRQAWVVDSGAAPFGAATGVLAAIAVPAFVKYMRKSKASEAHMKLMWLRSSVRSLQAEGMALPESVGPTPPAGACCKGGGDKCMPDAALWEHPSWQALGFSVDEPHYYSYQLEKAGDAFTVRAVGDLDCDGEFSTFEVYVGGDGGGSADVYTNNELE